MKTGLLLFAHGARDAGWAEPFERVGEAARALMPEAEVALAYLEFMAPGLEEAGAALVARGCARVEVVPLFLGAGGHVRKDVPQLFARLQQRFGAVQWRLHPAVGEADEVIVAMAEAAARLIAGAAAR